jgi:hypothetical protein
MRRPRTSVYRKEVEKAWLGEGQRGSRSQLITRKEQKRFTARTKKNKRSDGSPSVRSYHCTWAATPQVLEKDGESIGQDIAEHMDRLANGEHNE